MINYLRVLVWVILATFLRTCARKLHTDICTHFKFFKHKEHKGKHKLHKAYSLWSLRV